MTRHNQYPRSMTGQQGFTLLEILVAIGILAVMSIMAFGGLTYVIDSREQLDAHRADQRRLIMAMLRLEEDLLQIRDRRIRTLDGSDAPVLRGQPADTRALAEPSLEFTRGGQAIIGKVPRTDLVRVGYRLDDEGRLFRMTWPVLDRAPDTEARSQLLLEEVNDFKSRFYYDEHWVEQWPPRLIGETDKHPPLPLGIEVTIKFKDGKDIQRLIAFPR